MCCDFCRNQCELRDKYGAGYTMSMVIKIDYSREIQFMMSRLLNMCANDKSVVDTDFLRKFIFHEDKKEAKDNKEGQSKEMLRKDLPLALRRHTNDFWACLFHQLVISVKCKIIISHHKLF